MSIAPHVKALQQARLYCFKYFKPKHLTGRLYIIGGRPGAAFRFQTKASYRRPIDNFLKNRLVSAITNLTLRVCSHPENILYLNFFDYNTRH